jgi:hypothetical protein
MSAKFEETTVIQSNVKWIAHLSEFQTPKIGLTGTGTLLIQLTVKMIARLTLNLI